MVLKFNYNVNKNKELLEAFVFHAQNNPKSYEFKKAYALDGEYLPRMVGVYSWCPEEVPYESKLAYESKINRLLTNLRKSKNNNTMVSKKTLKEYEFKTIENYYNYIVDSIINGQMQQARKLTEKLSSKQLVQALDYYEQFETGLGNSHYYDVKRLVKETLRR